MIELQNITNSSKVDIIDLLLDEKKQPFEIYIPKESQQYFSSNENIAFDYGRWAYAGQKLKEVSSAFEYSYVAPTEHESACFTIETKDIQKLAEEIFEISLWYMNEFEEVEFLYDEISQFIEDLANSKIEPACKDFIEDFHTFNLEN